MALQPEYQTFVAESRDLLREMEAALLRLENAESDAKAIKERLLALGWDSDSIIAGTTHEEKQPPHLKILDLDTCYNRCTREFQNPCVRFCPANVYEMEVDEETGNRRMKLNFSNCVHCKTCDVKDPYENINWVPPEGGGGPKYTAL